MKCPEDADGRKPIKEWCTDRNQYLIGAQERKVIKENITHTTQKENV